MLEQAFLQTIGHLERPIGTLSQVSSLPFEHFKTEETLEVARFRGKSRDIDPIQISLDSDLVGVLW